jgi:hypothetical protein
MGMITERGQLMTLLVFLGVLVTLLILRLIPSLLSQLVLVIPRHRPVAMMSWAHGGKIGIALPRTNALFDVFSARRAPAAAGHLKFVLVSSSLLVLAVLATTAFWTWHSTGLMMLLR